MKALVTGSSGFIGSHLTQALLNKEYQVFCLIRKNSDLKWTKDMDYVFHLAAVLNAKNWDAYYNSNVRATQNLVEACAEVNPGIKKFVFVSRISASGPVYDKIFRDESCVCSPSSLYGKSKLYAEKVIHGFKEKIPVTIARPPNVIGPRQDKFFIVLKLLKNHLFPIIGKKDEQTSICFVKDLVRALIIMAEKEKARSQIYYVTDPKPYSWRKMLKITAQKMGVYPYVIKIPYPLLLSAAQFAEILAKITGKEPFITTRYICSTRNQYHLYTSQKIHDELGFKHQTKFSKGIEEIIEWYRRHNLL